MHAAEPIGSAVRIGAVGSDDNDVRVRAVVETAADTHATVAPFACCLSEDFEMTVMVGAGMFAQTSATTCATHDDGAPVAPVVFD